MPNWWTQWAERLALILAEWWRRPRSGGAGESPGAAQPDHHTKPDLEVPNLPPAPDADADARPH